MKKGMDTRSAASGRGKEELRKTEFSKRSTCNTANLDHVMFPLKEICR
jgi:hypothetical protein